MATPTYELADIRIDLSSGSPVITATGYGTALESGVRFAAARTVAPQGAALTRTNAVVADVVSYLSAQFGVIVTLPVAP